MALENILIIAFGYCVGSIPFAYLIVKGSAGVDLKSAGSGNIGARNAYEATNRPWIGVVVLVLDLLKGAVPVIVLERSEWKDFLPWVAVAIVLGHCYPVWLKFRGGRGLATTAGILFSIAPIFVAFWLALYWLIGRFYEDVHVDTLGAVLMVGIVALILPTDFLSRLTLDFSGQNPSAVRLCICLLALVIATRHVEPVMTRLSEAKRK